MPSIHPVVRSTLLKPADVRQKWWVVDAQDKVVGRLASDIAMILMGKHRPDYTPHVDMGDFVIVVNADKVVFTGRKWDNKQYTWYTGVPGLHVETARQRFEKHPTDILSEAVRRMLPKNKLARRMLARLKVYTGPTHNHQAQQPEAVELGAK